jgi:hypothetical protein
MMIQKTGVMKMSNTYGSSIYEYQPTYSIKKCPSLDDYDMNTSLDDENNNLYEMYSGYSRSKKYQDKNKTYYEKTTMY